MSKHFAEQLEFPFIREPLCPKCGMLPFIRGSRNCQTGQTKVLGLYCLTCDILIDESPVIGTTFQN